jgi:hypothetical protein
MMASEDIFIVIAPSVFSTIASQRNEILNHQWVNYHSLTKRGTLKTG